MQQVAEKFCSRARNEPATAPKKNKTNQLNIPEIRAVVGAEKFSLFPSADFAAKISGNSYLFPTHWQWIFGGFFAVASLLA